MGWALSHKDAAERLRNWYVTCADCEFALPIEGSSPEKNNCKARPGVFHTYREMICNIKPSVVERKRFIEDLRKKESGDGCISAACS